MGRSRDGASLRSMVGNGGWPGHLTANASLLRLQLTGAVTVVERTPSCRFAVPFPVPGPRTSPFPPIPSETPHPCSSHSAKTARKRSLSGSPEPDERQNRPKMLFVWLARARRPAKTLEYAHRVVHWTWSSTFNRTWSSTFYRTWSSPAHFNGRRMEVIDSQVFTQ